MRLLVYWNRYYFRLSKSESRRDYAGSLPIPGTQPGVPVTNNGHLVFFESCLRSVLVCKMKVSYTGRWFAMEKVDRRFICIHRRQPIPGNFPSVSWPIRFAWCPFAELLMFGIVQNLAREWWPFVFHMRGENGANSQPDEP